MDASLATTRALRARTQVFGPSVVVERGDTNIDLLPMMVKNLDRHNPCICVLDPEGSELAWTTVAAIAAFKSRARFKVEQLILFPTDLGFVRMLPIEREPEFHAIERLNEMFGTDKWQAIYRERKTGRSADNSRTDYVRLYAEGLKELGYKYVIERAVPKLSGPKYFLIFATDHVAGLSIMDHCFDRLWPPEGGQQSLWLKEPRPRRID